MDYNYYILEPNLSKQILSDSPSLFNAGSIKEDFFKKEVVILEDKKHMACSFHPELGDDFRIHEYFLNNRTD